MTVPHFLPTITEHARRRCHERHDVWPTRRDADLAVLDIIEGRAELLEVQASGREMHRVTLGPCTTIVIYEPVQACIVTVLGDNVERRDPLWGKRVWRDSDGRPRW